MTALEGPLPAALALDDDETPFDDELLDAAAAGSDLLDEDPDTLTDDARARREVQAWRPTDVGSAEWAMRKLAEQQQSLDAITIQAAEWQARIDRWHAGMVEKVERRAAFFRGALTRYALDERARTGQATISLPSGSLQTKDRKPRPKVIDRAAAAVSAIANLDTEDRAAVVDVPPMPAPVAKANELAKRVRIVESVQQRTFVVTCEGGAETTVVCPAGVEPPSVDGTATIDDGIDEIELPIARVDEDESARVVQQLVVWSDTGQPVEGVVVEPGRIDCTVSPATS